MEENIRKSSNSHRHWLAAFCAGSLVFLAVWLTTINGLGPIDDHQFIRTIFQGQSFGVYMSPELGRFFPLTAQEYVLASRLLEPSARLFFVINAIKVLLLGVLLFRCLALTKADNLIIAVLWSTALFSIGFANAAFRLHVGEFNILILSLCFIWSTVSIDATDQSQSMPLRILRIGGIVALIAAFFYKELIFVIALAFGASELLRHFRQTHTMASWRLWAILISGIIYIAGYGLWRTLYCTGSYAAFHAQSFIGVLSQYANNDPFLIFIILPLTTLRVLLILRDSTRHTVYDSFLVAASAYTVAYLGLEMYNTYYLLPAYGFGVCGLAGILALPSAPRQFKMAVATLAGIFCANTFPVAVSDMQSLQLMANNHYRFVSALSEWLWKNPVTDRAPRNLVLVGVTPGNGVEVLVSLKTFLTALGAKESSFHVIAAEPTDNQTISTFYGVSNSVRYTPKVNDLLIFNPYQQLVTLPPLLSPSYHELLRSESEWAIPRWSGVQWMQNVMRGSGQYKSIFSENRRYCGYAAMMLTRPKINNPVTHLQSKVYSIGPLRLPSRMRAGITRQCDVLIKNSGTELWPSNGTLDKGIFVHISYRWFDINNQVILEGDRVPIPEPMLPNDVTKVSMFLRTPERAGKYTLIISPVQEGVQWFPGIDGKEIEIY
jgi:hypothetical protein